MIDVLSLRAEALLKLKAAVLFPTATVAPDVHKKLLKKWHPDRCRDVKAGEVVAHINARYAEAKKAFEGGGYPDTLVIKTSKGEVLYPFIAARKTELGELYICKNHVIYACERQYDDLVKQALAAKNAFKFPNDEVKAKVQTTVPRNIHTIANGDRSYTIMARDRDYIRVIDLLEKGPLDPRHVAWILSRAYNLAGFLHYSDLHHMDISPESFFVEPSSHVGALLGGWFYSGYGSVRPKAAPGRTAQFSKVNRDKAHLSMIRIMGRRLLGCNTISEVKHRSDIPTPLKNWLTSSAGNNPHHEEKEWKKTLIDSFGPNRFTVLSIKTEDVYG